MMYLSSRKIIHRDLKPANFLISNNNNRQIQICDFGTIRQLRHDETQTKNSSYTVAYAPPEFINDDEVAGLFSDIWSLGVILHDIYYGEDLWKNMKNAEIIKNIIKKKLPKIDYNKAVPDEITEIIWRCLEFDGKNRITIEEINKIFEGIKK